MAATTASPEELARGRRRLAVLGAIEKVLAAGADAPRTPDLGGKASTADVGRAIEQAL